MLGAVIGDIVGSVYEFNNYRAKNFAPFFHLKSFFTDDTVCTVAVAEALTDHMDPAISLRKWGRAYWKNGGWGIRFAEWLGSEDEGPYNSFGNGSAMRVSPAGFLARSAEEAHFLSDLVTGVTHNHPEGMRGAAATAVAIYFARQGIPAADIRQAITDRFDYDLSMTVDGIRPTYRYNERAMDTVPQALICALEATDFEDAIRNAISIGGDSDTIAAIAGGVAESIFGIPESIARTAWGKIPTEMQAVLTKLYATAEHRNGVTQDVAKITVAKGSIIKQYDCDGIVNAANENLRAGSGVCGAIHAAAGQELEKHCAQFAPLALSEALATPSFALPHKKIIHTRGPKFLFDPEPQDALSRAITNTLMAADREQLSKLALPAISTGVYGYPPDEAIPVMVKAAHLIRARLHYLKEIRFVTIDEAMAGRFARAIDSLSE